MNQIKLGYIRQLLKMPIRSLKNMAYELEHQEKNGQINKEDARERLIIIRAAIQAKEINIENHKNLTDQEED